MRREELPYLRDERLVVAGLALHKGILLPGRKVERSVEEGVDPAESLEIGARIIHG